MGDKLIRFGDLSLGLQIPIIIVWVKIIFIFVAVLTYILLIKNL